MKLKTFPSANLIKNPHSNHEIKENKQGLWSRLKDLSWKIKIIRYLFKKLYNLRDRYYFEPTLSLLQIIMEKNSRQIRCFRISPIEYLLGRVENIEKFQVYLEKIEKDLCETYKSSKDQNKNIEAISLNLKVKMKTDIRFIDLAPNNFEENPLLSSPSRRKFLSLALDEQCFFKEIKTKEFDPNSSIKFKDFFVLFFEIIISNWDKICYVLLVFYHFYSKALSSFFIILYLFVFIVTEEHHNVVRSWKPLFLYIFTVSIIKIIMFLPFVKSSAIENKTPYEDNYLPIYEVLALFLKK